MRSVKLLHDATRPFAEESLTKSWWYTGSTLVLLAIVLTGAGHDYRGGPFESPFRYLEVCLWFAHSSCITTSCIGAMLRKSRLGKLIYYLYGLISLTPARSWRHSHNFHHAQCRQANPGPGRTVFTFDIGHRCGSLDDCRNVETSDADGDALRYRVSRHPFSDSVCLCDRLSVQRLPDSAVNSIPASFGMERCR